jgi:hypothetical protein
MKKILGDDSGLFYSIDSGFELYIYKKENDKIEDIYNGSVFSFIEEIMKDFNIKKDQ